LALEGAGLPFTSRLKEKLKLILAAHPGSALLAAADLSSADGGAKATKRGPKPTHGDAGAASASGESWTARIVASGVEDCVSSDEEDNYERQVYAHVQEGAMDVPLHAAYAQDYVPFPVQGMAVAPDLVWPVQLLVIRRKPVTGSGGSANNGAAPAPTPSYTGVPSGLPVSSAPTFAPSTASAASNAAPSAGAVSDGIPPALSSTLR